MKSQTVFDRERDHYQMVNLGWKNNNTRIYGCAIHVDIIDGKIWVQHDGTEEAIAYQTSRRPTGHLGFCDELVRHNKRGRLFPPNFTYLNS
ncbi:MAG: XisI protein [Okeania sp. SIO2D1]|nr:XisI protein [Okeania sp. SIO2D1]